MYQIDSQKPFLVALTSIAFCLILSTNAFSHSGHKHHAPPISLPNVVAQVNGQEIEKEVILRELKKIIRRCHGRNPTEIP